MSKQSNKSASGEPTLGSILESFLDGYKRTPIKLKVGIK